MKENKVEKVIVTEYVSDFGEVFKDKNACRESECKRYKSMLKKASESEFAPLIEKLIEEIDKHHMNAYCSIGIDDKMLREILQKHLHSF